MLFNRNGTGSEELQQITGIFAASNNFSTVEMEIEDATRAVRLLVGQAVITAAEGHYLASGGQSGLAAAVRTPIAILAVARYTRGNLVSHEDSGSKVKLDSNEQMPWEWMVDRDERALQERYYRALDALYEYLNENAVPEWTGSAEYQRYRKSIVRTLGEFEAVYPVDGSYYVYYMLQNLVIECQSKLRKMIGDERWAQVSADTMADGSAELCQLCRRWAVLSAVVKAVRRWSLEVFPLSIARRFCPSYQGGRSSRAATREEMDAYVDGLEAQIEDVRAELAELLADSNPWEGFDPQPRNNPSNKFFTAQ